MQRWLFRRELERLAPTAIFYLDPAARDGVDHRLYRESGRTPRGERIYQEVAGARRERTSIISASQQGKLVAPLVFQDSCNTEVVDACFEKGLLPVLPPGTVIVLDTHGFINPRRRSGWWRQQAVICCFCRPTRLAEAMARSGGARNCWRLDRACW